MSHENIWPEVLMIRDTGLHDDLGGAGQRIYTTSGQGYEKRKYLREDVSKLVPGNLHELQTALNRMVLAHENLLSDTEGRYPPPDCGCIECTVGTVPDRLNTGLCAYHNAKKLLGQS